MDQDEQSCPEACAGLGPFTTGIGWCIALAWPTPRISSHARMPCVQKHIAQHQARQRGARQSLGGDLFMSLTRRDAMTARAPSLVLQRRVLPCRARRAWSVRLSECMPKRVPV